MVIFFFVPTISAHYYKHHNIISKLILNTFEMINTSIKIYVLIIPTIIHSIEICQILKIHMCGGKLIIWQGVLNNGHAPLLQQYFPK